MFRQTESMPKAVPATSFQRFSETAGSAVSFLSAMPGRHHQTSNASDNHRTASSAHLPVVMVHGMHARDYSILDSPLWGRIPDFLRAQGNSAWFGNTEAWGSVEDNAKIIAHTIERVIQETGAPQVHLVAHSKGALDARASIHVPGIAPYVASFVALAPPNRGLRLCSFLAHIPLLFPKIVRPIMMGVAHKMGDDNPKPMAVLECLGEKNAREIYRKNPDIAGIEYRNYGFITHLKGAQKLHAQRLLVWVFDGQNDGLVPIASTEGTNWTLVEVQDGCYFDHDDSYDLNRKEVTLTLPDGTHYPNSAALVVSIIRDLDELVQKSNVT